MSEYLKRPPFTALLSLLAGSFVGIGTREVHIVWGLLLTLGPLVIITIFQPRLRKSCFLILFIIIFIAIGFTQQAVITAQNEVGIELIDSIGLHEMEYVSVTGEIDGFPRRTAAGWTLYLKSGGVLEYSGKRDVIPAPLAVRISAPDSVKNNSFVNVPGDTIKCVGKLYELPHNLYSGEPYSWLRQNGAIAFLHVSSSLSGLEEVEKSNSVLSTIYRGGARTSHALQNEIDEGMSTQSAALLKSLMLGKTYDLSQTQRDVYRRAGLLHLFAVSGLHTLLMGSILLILLRVLQVPVASRLILLAIFLFLFALLIGFRASVVRASILLLLYESTHLLKRPVEPVGSLSTLAVFYLLLSPESLWKLDFQMSFLCTFTLVFIAPMLIRLEEVLGPRLGWSIWASLAIKVIQLFFVSVFIQIALSPLVFYHFGEFSLLAPFANALLVPFIVLIVKVAYTLLLVGALFPALMKIGLTLLELPLLLCDEAALIFGGEGVPFLVLGKWHVILPIALYMIALGSTWILNRRFVYPIRTWHEYLSPLLLAVLLFTIIPVFYIGTSSLKVSFLDVSQGDAILLEAPGNRRILIDTGPEFASWYFPDFFRSRGINKLEAVILTHPDADHLGGYIELLEVVKVGKVYTNGDSAETTEFQEILEIIERKDIEFQRLSRGDSVADLGRRVSIEVLHPSEFSVGEERNEASIVLMIEFAGKRLLLTGDTGIPTEQTLISLYGDRLQADLLKAGHHGSKTSTSQEFLNVVQPDIVTLNCGRFNRYGHPSNVVLRRLDQHGPMILRTDEDGTIEVKISGDGHLTWRTLR